MTERLLLLGNKKYSSWSLRAWIGLTEAGVPFEERVVKLFRAETAEELRRYSPAGLVPVLVEGDLTVHDSLAILETVNERHAAGKMWPGDPHARAVARSVSAEMHAGFPNLRSRLPMNLARPPGPPGPDWAIDAATRTEIKRVLTMWERLLGEHGGPCLFGAWSIADCMYLPVATRLRTYAVDLANHRRSAAYMAHLLALPSFLRWEAAGRAETEEHADYDR